MSLDSFRVRTAIIQSAMTVWCRAERASCSVIGELPVVSSSIARPCGGDLVGRIIIRRESKRGNLITVNRQLVAPLMCSCGGRHDVLVLSSGQAPVRLISWNLSDGSKLASFQTDPFSEMQIFDNVRLG